MACMPFPAQTRRFSETASISKNALNRLTRQIFRNIALVVSGSVLHLVGFHDSFISFLS